MISQIIFVVALSSLAAASIIPVHHAPKPYKFGYDIKDKHGEQYRQEEGNGGAAVKGSYGFTDARGVKRQVDYVADHGGFRAQVKTNEPGTANQNPAAVHMVSDAPYAGGAALGGLGLGAPVAGNFALGGVGLGVPAVAGYGLGGYGAGNLGYGLRVGGYGAGNLGYGLGVGGYGAGNLGYGLGVGEYGAGNLGYGLGGLGYARYGY